MALSAAFRYAASMLTVLIETRNHEEALVRTLGSLVGAVVEGIVREVVVCDLGSADRTSQAAEHAGCHFLPDGGIAAGVRRAKADWLLILEPGARMVDGWTAAAMEHVTTETGPARFARARVDRRLFSPGMLAMRAGLSRGLLISRRQATELIREGADARSLARGLYPRRLAAEIRVAGKR